MRPNYYDFIDTNGWFYGYDTVLALTMKAILLSLVNINGHMEMGSKISVEYYLHYFLIRRKKRI